MKTALQVQNLKCEGCGKTIVSHLSKLNGISKVDAEPETSTVMVEHQTEEELELVKEKLRVLGYPTLEDENGILLRAKSYMSCAVGKFGNLQDQN